MMVRGRGPTLAFHRIRCMSTGNQSFDPTNERVLACNMNALSAEQRARHADVTKRLLEAATRTEAIDAYIFRVDRQWISVAELAEWVADESRCCPAVDFQVELPAFGPLTLRLGGGADVKAFMAAELHLPTT